MDKLMWETQRLFNETVKMQMEIYNKQITNLLSILEDHENDMQKMCDKINELERKLSESNRA